MTKTLYFSPPKLVPWLDDELRNTSVLLLDIEPDFTSDNKIHMDLNIIFRSIPVKTGIFQQRNYYVGSTSARIMFKATGGKVNAYTGPTTLKVNHEQSTKRSRQSGVKVSPAIEIGQDVKVSAGDITFQKDVESTHTIKFSSAERSLAPVFMRDAVEWEIALPKGENAIRDYLFGNLYLYVDSEWLTEGTEGWIEAQPLDILFFDSKRHAISAAKSLIMRFKLWEQGITVSRENLKIYFKDKQ